MEYAITFDRFESKSLIAMISVYFWKEQTWKPFLINPISLPKPHNSLTLNLSCSTLNHKRCVECIRRTLTQLSVFLKWYWSIGLPSCSTRCSCTCYGSCSICKSATCKTYSFLIDTCSISWPGDCINQHFLCLSLLACLAPQNVPWPCIQRGTRAMTPYLAQACHKTADNCIEYFAFELTLNEFLGDSFKSGACIDLYFWCFRPSLTTQMYLVGYLGLSWISGPL